MLKSNNVKIFKALAMSALLTNGGIGAEDEKRQDQTINGPIHKVGVTKEADRDTDTANFVSTLMYIADQGDKITNGLHPMLLRSDRLPRLEGDDHSGNMVSFINQYLEMISERTRARQDIMRQPRTIDLGVKGIDNVLNFLQNARRYNTRVKLRLLNITPQQLDAILNGINEEIEELDWTYRPMPISSIEDLDAEDAKKYETKTDTDLDDEDEEDEFETTGKDKRKTGKNHDDDDDDIDDDEWGNHVDRDGVAVPRPRRAAARGRDPLLLVDLVDFPGRRGVLIPPHRVVDVPVPVVHAHYVPAPVANANYGPNDRDNPILVNARGPAAISYATSQNPSNSDISKPHAQVPAHNLVHIFCRHRAKSIDVR